MKGLKITTVLLLTVILVCGTLVTAFASPNTDVINELKEVGKVPATYIIQAENYLKTRELTQVEADAVIAQIMVAADIMKNAGVTDLSKLSSADTQKILAVVTEAGAVLDIAISVKKSADGTYTIIGMDSTGQEVVNFSSKVVKQTGSNDLLLLFGIILLAAAGGSTLLVKKYSSALTVAV